MGATVLMLSSISDISTSPVQTYASPGLQTTNTYCRLTRSRGQIEGRMILGLDDSIIMKTQRTV